MSIPTGYKDIIYCLQFVIPEELMSHLVTVQTMPKRFNCTQVKNGAPPPCWLQQWWPFNVSPVMLIFLISISLQSFFWRGTSWKIGKYMRAHMHARARTHTHTEHPRQPLTHPLENTSSNIMYQLVKPESCPHQSRHHHIICMFHVTSSITLNSVANVQPKAF